MRLYLDDDSVSRRLIRLLRQAGHTFESRLMSTYPAPTTFFI